MTIKRNKRLFYARHAITNVIQCDSYALILMHELRGLKHIMSNEFAGYNLLTLDIISCPKSDIA